VIIIQNAVGDSAPLPVLTPIALYNQVSGQWLAFLLQHTPGHGKTDSWARMIVVAIGAFYATSAQRKWGMDLEERTLKDT
jgi:hypothetical protein